MVLEKQKLVNNHFYLKIGMDMLVAPLLLRPRGSTGGEGLFLGELKRQTAVECECEAVPIKRGT